jgi:DNA-directed RNA polymerase specialized sigma24 family protein
LATDKELSDFLKSVEKRAFKRTAYAVRDDDAALDIVQDAMIRLAEKYADRPAAELPLVFQRILSNATMDWFRRQKVRNAVVQNLSEFEGADDDGDFDLLETLHAVGHAWARRVRPMRFRGNRSCADRAEVARAARPSTGSLPAALLGGIRCGRDRASDGLL